MARYDRDAGAPAPPPPPEPQQLGGRLTARALTGPPSVSLAASENDPRPQPATANTGFACPPPVAAPPPPAPAPRAAAGAALRLAASAEAARLDALRAWHTGLRAAVSGRRARLLADREAWKVEAAALSSSAAAGPGGGGGGRRGGGESDDVGARIHSSRKAQLRALKAELDRRSTRVNDEVAAARAFEAWLGARAHDVDKLCAAVGAEAGAGSGDAQGDAIASRLAARLAEYASAVAAAGVGDPGSGASLAAPAAPVESVLVAGAQLPVLPRHLLDPGFAPPPGAAAAGLPLRGPLLSFAGVESDSQSFVTLASPGPPGEAAGAGLALSARQRRHEHLQQPPQQPPLRSALSAPALTSGAFTSVPTPVALPLPPPGGGGGWVWIAPSGPSLHTDAVAAQQLPYATAPSHPFYALPPGLLPHHLLPHPPPPGAAAGGLASPGPGPSSARLRQRSRRYHVAAATTGSSSVVSGASAQRSLESFATSLASAFDDEGGDRGRHRGAERAHPSRRSHSPADRRASSPRGAAPRATSRGAGGGGRSSRAATAAAPSRRVASASPPSRGGAPHAASHAHHSGRSPLRSHSRPAVDDPETMGWGHDYAAAVPVYPPHPYAEAAAARQAAFARAAAFLAGQPLPLATHPLPPPPPPPPLPSGAHAGMAGAAARPGATMAAAAAAADAQAASRIAHQLAQVRRRATAVQLQPASYRACCPPIPHRSGPTTPQTSSAGSGSTRR